MITFKVLESSDSFRNFKGYYVTNIALSYSIGLFGETGNQLSQIGGIYRASGNCQTFTICNFKNIKDYLTKEDFREFLRFIKREIYGNESRQVVIDFTAYCYLPNVHGDWQKFAVPYENSNGTQMIMVMYDLKQV